MVVLVSAAYSASVDDAYATRPVPDELWAIVQPLIPAFAPRAQGGGRGPADPRSVHRVYVQVSGCAWRLLPPSLEVDFRTTHWRLA